MSPDQFCGGFVYRMIQTYLQNGISFDTPGFIDTIASITDNPSWYLDSKFFQTYDSEGVYDIWSIARYVIEMTSTQPPLLAPYF
jgi:hypothetical protein